MPLHPGFLEDICAHPDDDTPRLIYADWLEERGDPLGTFIRTQCAQAKLDPVADAARFRELESQCRALRNAHQDQWLGSLHALEQKARFHPTFHRGFVTAAGMPGSIIPEHAEALTTNCPLLTDVTLYHCREQMTDVLLPLPAEYLNKWSRLTVADFVTDSDTDAVKREPGLSGLRYLRLWGYGDQNDAHLVQSLCEFEWSQPNRIIIQLMRGSTNSLDESGSAETMAVELEQTARAMLGINLLRVTLPTDRAFRVRSAPYYSVWTGVLPKHRQAIVAIDGTFTGIVRFDHLGNYLDEEQLEDFSIEGNSQSEGLDWNESDLKKMLMGYLKRAIGFDEKPVEVKAFSSTFGLSVSAFTGSQVEFLESDFEPSSLGFEEHMPFMIQRSIDENNCVLEWGAEYYLDGRGRVCSS